MEKYTKCEVMFKAASVNAVLISFQDEEFWVPRTLLSYQSDSEINRLKRNDVFTLELFDWKAKRLGMG